MASTGTEDAWGAPLEALLPVLDAAGIGYALIGGNARNFWTAPIRTTDDFDFIVLAGRDGIESAESALLAEGYFHLRRDDSGSPSGPDFVRMASPRRDLILDLQTARTDYQALVVRRAVETAGGVRVATPEDLIVLKLIAFRGIDQRDLVQLLKLDGLDWAYIAEWAKAWEVSARLEQIRTA